MGTYNHTGQVVTDLERSKRFYQEVIGFKYWFEFSPPDEGAAKLSSLDPPLGITICYLTLDGFVLELIHYSAPEAFVPYRPRRPNEPGLKHNSFGVKDVQAAAAKAVEYGGEILSDIGVAVFMR